MKTLRVFLFVIISMVGFLIPSAFADEVSDAKINESVDVFFPDEGRSILLVQGTPIQVLATSGDYATISLKLKNGYSIQTQIETKYLTISPQKQDSVTGIGVLGPNPVTASPISPAVLPPKPAAQVVETNDFFDLEEVTFHKNAAPDELQVYQDVPQLDGKNQPLHDKNKKPIVNHIPVPFLAARVSVKGRVMANTVSAKAYFYDENRQLIASDSAPSLSRLKPDDKPSQPWSVFIQNDQRPTVLFAVPDKVLSTENWSAVIIFGDNKGVDANVYCDGGEQDLVDYDFPEKKILEDKNGPPIERKTAMDPLVEHVVQTDNPKQPQITLFMRPPLGMTDASEAKGVLCLSLLAGSLEDVKRQLEGFEAGDDLGGILGHAGSPIADNLGLKFFDYALSIKDLRAAYDQSLNDPLNQFQSGQSNSENAQPWLSSFCHPAFVGDAVNQGIVPYDQKDRILTSFFGPTSHSRHSQRLEQVRLCLPSRGQSSREGLLFILGRRRIESFVLIRWRLGRRLLKVA